MPPDILVICGPTASGKTRLGVELALRLDGEVVSADSMQVYRGMDVGTAKPTPAERRGVPHHMLDVADPGEAYSVARFVADASRCVDDILARGKRPLVVGGTGLYIDALVAGRHFAPFHGARREALLRRAETQGIRALHEELRAVDPERAAKLHPADQKRVIRALEVWYETGRTISQHDAATRAAPPHYRALFLGLAFRDRADMWSRIDARVDEMAANGLADEVSALLAAGVSPRCTSMQAIGYKELAAALREGQPLGEALDQIKLRTRQYAKRQLTWFRRRADVRWHLWGHSPDFSRAVQDSTAYLEEFGIL